MKKPYRNLKKFISFRNVRLYVIVDKETCKNLSIVNVAKLVISGGCDFLQLRDKISTTKTFLKEALSLKMLTLKEKVPFIINDRADIACLVNADGLHIGQDDIPVKLARKIMGKNKIIGVSCHNLKQVIKTQKDGADYISFGPIFHTPFKPDLKPKGINIVKEIIQKARIPVFAIGGINQGNIQKIIDSNINRIAVIKAVLENENIEKATKNLKFKLK